MRKFVKKCLCLAVMLAVLPTLHAHPGDLDTTFGQNGTTVIPITSSGVTSVESGRAVAVQPDGKVLIVGTADNDVAIMRLTTNGVLDSTFGIGGKVAANFSGGSDAGNAVAVLTNGNFIVGGAVATTNTGELFLIARYLTNGVLDTTFGNSGTTQIEFGNPSVFDNNNLVSAIAIQPDGKIVALGWGGTTNINLEMVRLNANGSLDSTFGTGGQVVTSDPSNANLYGNAVALQPDGKILVAGQSIHTATNILAAVEQFEVARYLPNGLPDTTFGTNGFLTIGLGSNIWCSAVGIALQSSGKIIIGGSISTGIGGFMVARLNTNGIPDTTFGYTNGINDATFTGSAENSANAMLVFTNDTIQLVGSVQLAGGGINYTAVNFSTNGAALSGTRYSANFSATNYNEVGLAAAILPNNNVVIVGQTQQNDSGDIGVVGLSATPIEFGQFPVGIAVNSAAECVALQPDGKVVAAGYAQTGNTLPSGVPIYSGFVTRLNANGMQDMAFGSGGLVMVTNSITNGGVFIWSEAIQSDGKIMIAGDFYTNEISQACLLRFTPSGILDATFATNGIGLYNPIPGITYNFFTSVKIQSDGKIVTSGVTGTNFVIARFLTNGIPDTGFANGGFLTLPLGLSSVAKDVQLLPNGKIVAVGDEVTIANINYAAYVAVQVKSNGSLDFTFGSNGVQTYNLNSLGDFACSLAIQKDGNLVIGGYSNDSGGQTEAGIIRSLTNGILDSTFAIGGDLRTNFGALALYANSVKIQTNGKIVVGGQYNSSSGPQYIDDFSLFRLLPNGAIDSTFGSNGLAYSSPPGLAVAGFIESIAIQNDGSIVAAGGAGGSIALARYLGDPTPPTITVPSNIVAEATGPAGAVVAFTTSATNSTGVVATTNAPPSGSIFPLGITTVTVTATDTNGNSATNTFTVTVRDTTPPVITVSSNIVAEATSAAGAVVSFTTTATDLVSGTVPTTNSPTSGSIFPLGTTTVRVTAGDAAGNIATNTFTVKVQDTTPPVITLLGGSRLTNTLHTVFTDPGATATDTVAGNLTSAIVVTGTVNTNTVGSYLLTYTVSDTYSNTAATNRTVVVVAPVPPPLSIALASVASLATNGSGNFVVASSPGAGPGPVPLVAFTNADGNVDLVCGDTGNNQLALLTNNGSGSFAISTTYPLPSQPFAMIAADINGDGKLDIISGNYYSGTLSIFTNNGIGGFAQASQPGAGGYPRALAAFTNVDGKVDLICANYTAYTLTLLANNGGGNFSFGSTINLTGNAISVAAGDFNGDGRVDLVYGNWGTGGSGNTVTVLTNNGTGGFVASGTYTVGYGPIYVAAADVNGDGKPDIISVNYIDRTVMVLTNSGSGGFAPASTNAVGSYPFSVTVADVNGDNKPDLVCANSGTNTLTVLTNNGSGGFAWAATLVVGQNPNMAVVSDVNHDGRVELICTAASDNTLTVLTNAPAVVTNKVNGVVISWPAPSTGFVLQQNGSMGTTNWTTNSSAITTANGTNSVSITPAAGNQFFRLNHP